MLLVPAEETGSPVFPIGGWLLSRPSLLLRRQTEQRGRRSIWLLGSHLLWVQPQRSDVQKSSHSVGGHHFTSGASERQVTFHILVLDVTPAPPPPPGLPPCKEHSNQKKSFIVIYENSSVIQSPYKIRNPCKS